MRLQMVRDLEAPGKGTHVSMWQDMSNLLMKVVVMAAGVRSLPFATCARHGVATYEVQLSFLPVSLETQQLQLPTVFEQTPQLCRPYSGSLARHGVCTQCGCVLHAGGAVVGFAFGWATRKLIKWLRHRGAKPPQVRLRAPACSAVASTKCSAVTQSVRMMRSASCCHQGCDATPAKASPSAGQCRRQHFIGTEAVTPSLVTESCQS